MTKCCYADCGHDATHAASYVYNHIPLYSLPVCEAHANELIDQHNNEADPLRLIELVELRETHELLIVPDND